MSRFCFGAAVLASLLIASLVPASAAAQEKGGDRVCIEPQESLSFPFTHVMIRIDYEKERLGVEPETATIYVEPENPNRPTQVLWQVECLDKRHYTPAQRRSGKVSDCLAPKDELVIRPKKGCSTRLFGKEIRIRPGDSAVSSGLPNTEAALRLFKEEADAKTICDGRSRARLEEEMGMKLGGGHDITWAYEVLVMRGGEVILSLDPQLWVEKEGGG